MGARTNCAKARAARAGKALKRMRGEEVREVARQANAVNRHGAQRAGVELKVWQRHGGWGAAFGID